MTLRHYLFSLTLATLICWGAWLLILFNVDPFKTSLFGFIIFYLSLSLALFGTFSLLGFLARFLLFTSSNVYIYVVTSARQGMLLSLLLVGLLLLQSFRILAFLNLIIYILILSFLEFAFSSAGQKQQ